MHQFKKSSPSSEYKIQLPVKTPKNALPTHCFKELQNTTTKLNCVLEQDVLFFKTTYQNGFEPEVLRYQIAHQANFVAEIKVVPDNIVNAAPKVPLEDLNLWLSKSSECQGEEHEKASLRPKSRQDQTHSSSPTLRLLLLVSLSDVTFYSSYPNCQLSPSNRHSFPKESRVVQGKE